MSNHYTLEAPNVKHNRELTGPIPRSFDTDILPDPRDGFMLALVARRGQGKSFLMYNLLKKFYKGCFDEVYIFNPSYGNDLTLSEESLGLESNSFFDRIDVDFIQAVIDRQIEEKKNYENGKLKKRFLTRVLFVFDDCITDSNFCSNSNTNLLNMLAFRARHLRISTILSSQVYNGFAKRFRVNCPNWIFFRVDNQKERKAIIEEQSFIDERKFEAIFDHATRMDHDFLYIYGTCKNRKHCFRRNLDNIIQY